MATKILILFVIIFISCSDNNNDLGSSKEEATSALYKYDLPADGCDWHFSIYDKSETLLLIEDAASKPKTEILKTEAKKVIGLPNVTVLLTYKLTGKKQKVQCGWNKTQDMQEINIVKVEIK